MIARLKHSLKYTPFDLFCVINLHVVDDKKAFFKREHAVKYTHRYLRFGRFLKASGSM